MPRYKLFQGQIYENAKRKDSSCMEAQIILCDNAKDKKNDKTANYVTLPQSEVRHKFTYLRYNSRLVVCVCEHATDNANLWWA